ncbi:MAG: hypothetical protein A2Y77_03980 [Planctomycetes bacterium RBG_13_62_9]|nr:MAG: hypothetical protein A2Y77_03980 [Planctomycetes bacterium RBG_13_62_9]
MFLACELFVPVQAAEAPVPATAVASAEMDQELVLIKDQLLNNKDEATRISAASVLLYKEDPIARALVLDALRQTENPLAQAAVCRALDRSRTDSRLLPNRGEFLQPLIDILGVVEDPGMAQLAAEATLMFTYDQVQAGLEGIAGDSQLPVTVRCNAIYALQLHPDKRAVLRLIALLEDPDGTVASAAGDALNSLGISFPEDAEGRRRAITALEQQGPEAYLQKRLVRSEADIRALRAAVLRWQEYHRSVLDEWYATLADVTAKSGFVGERLKTPEPEVRLWALDRLGELMRGTGKFKLSEETGKTLLSLLSSRNRQVRLKTAQLLARMGELNSAGRLLQQLKVEEDAEVRHEMFVALGSACYSASLESSPFKVPDEVRKETLAWAVRFLNETRPERAKSGAEVIRKLLTQNGLKPEELNTYLTAVAQRYEEATTEANPALRGDLLAVMAGLCAQQSVCRAQATREYSPLFEQALGDSVESIREVAVGGFISIDSAAALKKLRSSMVDDSSSSIRAKLMDLAGEVGGAEDLDLLATKLGTPGEGERAWQVMLKIFNRLGMDAIATWAGAIITSPLQDRLSTEQKLAYFVLVEQRAQGNSRADLLAESRRTIAGLCAASGDFKRAAEYLKLLEDAAATEGEKKGLLSDRLAVCLRWPNLEMACEIVSSRLLASDLTADDPVAQSIESFLAEPPSGVDPNALIKRLTMIKVTEPDGRPGWRELLQRWSKPVARAQESAETEEINN